MKQLLLFVFLLSIVQINSQTIPDEIKPPSWNLNELSNLKAKKLPFFDLKTLQDEDAINDKDKSKPWRFGYEIYVDDDLFEEGQLTELPNGDKIWRMSYTSEGAFSLNFMFDRFKIPIGAKLYVYNNEKDDLLRPFSHHNNNPEEVLGTWLVNGNTAIIEYFEPANVSSNAKLVVGSVVHGYRTGHMFQKALNDSGPCNHDVDCDITPASDPYNINQKKEDVKAANAMMVVGSSGFCSGTLINNTNNDGTPYFLTANHCGGGEAGWAFRFNWRSPNPSCGTFTNSTNGSFNQTVSGATFRASSSRSDMKLVEITDASFIATNSSNLVWAGWNRSTTQLPNLNFGIHHPSGDIQKVCRDDQGATRTSTFFNGDPNTQVWRIADWDLGVTEPGSSGSALYNEDGHIVGLLSGGSAACAGTNDNGGFDIYGRFGVAWDFGSNNASRLDFWLDPAGTNPVTLDQFPPLQVFNNDARVNIGSGSASFLCNQSFDPSVTLNNPGALNLTSATVSYFLDSDAPTVVNWTGDLSQTSSEVVATPSYPNLSPGNHVFTVTVSNPNGVVDENSSNNTFVFNFTVAQDFATTEVVFNILTDDYAEETSWQLTDSANNVIDSGFFTDPQDNQNFQITIPIPVFDECYTFTINDSFGDGICCGFGAGSYNLEDENGNEIISGGQFSSSESITFKALNPLSISDSEFQNQFRFYPNPVNDLLSIESNNVIGEYNYQVINTLGQSVIKGKVISSGTNTLSMRPLEAGIYFIKISAQDRTFTYKLIKE